MKKILLFPLLLLACSLKSQPEIIGVVNGRTIRSDQVAERLKTQLEVIEKASLDQKRIWLDQMAEEIAVQDEMAKTGYSFDQLMRFLSVIEGVAVSEREREVFVERHPEYKTQAAKELDQVIKTDRRSQVEKKYREELKKRAAVRFLANDKKQSKVQEIWDRLKF